MIISASTELAQNFIHEILNLSLNEEIVWKSYEATHQYETIRAGNGERSRYLDIEAGIHAYFRDYHLHLYRVDLSDKDTLCRREGYILHINSPRHGKKRFVGELDGKSHNQDLATIFRKATSSDFPKKNPVSTSVQGLDYTLARFFDEY